MYNISRESARAFDNNRNFKKRNTVVKATDSETAMYLWGNKIAWKNSDGYFFSMCGWDTRTTKDRLSALGIRISQKNHTQYWHKIRDDKPIELDTYGIYQVA